MASRTACDPDRRVSGALGLSAPAVAVFDPEFRLAALHPGAAFPKAVADCARMFGRTVPVIVTAQPPVLLIPDVIEPELRADAIEAWHRNEKIVNRVISPDAVNTTETVQKRRSDVYLGDTELARVIGARIHSRVFPRVRKAFGFEAAEYVPLKVGCYDSANSGAFGRHRDNATRFTASRQFAMTLNLNAGDYEGGELWFPEYGRQRYRPGAGDAAVFSCSLLHEALPVTSGRRFGIFTFFFDREAAVDFNRVMAAEQEGGDAALD